MKILKKIGIISLLVVTMPLIIVLLLILMAFLPFISKKYTLDF